MAREGTKTARAIAVMVANKDKPMEEVLPLIAEATGHDIPHARNYYLWCVRKGVAPGQIPTVTRTRTLPPSAPKAKAPKAVAKAAPKAAKAPAKAKAKAGSKKAEDSPRSGEDLAAIKAANVARLKEIHDKFQAKKKLDPRRMNVPKNVDVEDVSADEMHDRLDAYKEELDSFAPPKFLQKGQLKAMGV